MVEVKNVVEPTTPPVASQEKIKADDSKQVGVLSKNVEELQEENKKLQETLGKAEHTIVKLKKEEPVLDLESIKGDILKEVEEKINPRLEDLEKLSTLERENRELKKSISSKESANGTGGGASVPKDKSIIQPTKKDHELAAKYFGGDIEKFMKYKKKD